jgi:DNA-binding MarR family transcriptional regulator
MNYSDMEHSGIRTDDEALIEAGVKLLPALGRSLYCAIAELAHAHRLTPAQMKVLLAVAGAGQLTIGEIAAALGVSMPAASEIVDRLVDAGHLVRAADPADRRRVLIAATPESQRMHDELIACRRAQVRSALDRLAPVERPAFVRALQALVAGLDTAAGTRTATYEHPPAGAFSSPCSSEGNDSPPSASGRRPRNPVIVDRGRDEATQVKPVPSGRGNKR